MFLKKTHIKNFRCIDDSGEFEIDRVTCLVGKNESGKTAILKALYRIKPENANDKFNAIMDYPKKKWRPNMGNPAEIIVISEWEFEKDDLEKLSTEFGESVLSKKNVRIEIGYENTRKYYFECDEQALVNNLISKYQITFESGTNITTLENLKSVITGIQNKSENHTKLLLILNNELKDGLKGRIINLIDSMLPTFLYFDQYTRLPGNVSINDFYSKKSKNGLSENERIFVALMDLAGTSIDAIVNATTFEEFNSSMKAVSNHISDEIFKYWTQNRHLEVELKFDSARTGDPSPFNAGFVFRTRINNKRHRADTSFDERSSGFVWFFSFLIWFQQLKQMFNKKLIILLDEPGLTLHSRAQGDLLRYINEQLKPEYQVIYTTHSPFMIDTDNILSSRTVEDVVIKDKKTGDEMLLGTKVSNKVLSTDPDTISPLQRALDYELTQSLFIGKNNILVEGPSDYLYIKWFSRKLQEKGNDGLDYRWTISIVKGLDKIPGYVSLFQANLLHIAVLIDVQSGHKQKIDNIRKILKEKHLFLATDFLNGIKKEEADIEDILGNQFYISLINESYRLTLGLTIDESKINLNTNKRIVNEVKEYFATLPVHIQEFDHYFPAEYLYNIEKPEVLKGYELALKNMEKLINDLNALLK